MARKRIRYLLRTFDKPFGGPQQIRRHVKVLVDHGFDAAIVIDGDSDAHFYNITIPKILNREFNMDKDDICVVPEGWREHYVQLRDKPSEKICFCQNHYYVHRGFHDNESFKTFGVSTVLCCSRQVANHIERYYDIADVAVVPCGIELPTEASRIKTMSISYMPRKAHLDAGLIKSLFRRKFPSLASVEWVSIDGLSHSDAMSAIQRTSIFLSLSHREGFGLPPVEAMSLRTLVVGFHGGGGLEYATSRNGYWLTDGDLVGCVDALGTAVELLRARSGEANDMIEEGYMTAQRFTMASMEDKLLRFWRERV